MRPLWSCPRAQPQALVGECARSLGVALTVCLDGEPGEHVSNLRIGAELAKRGECLLVPAGALFEVADDVGRASADAESRRAQHRWKLFSPLEHGLEPAGALFGAAGHPVLLERHGERCGQRRVARGEGPVDCAPQIVGFRDHELVPRTAFERLDRQARRLREGQEELGVTTAHRVCIAGLLEALERELADRLQHPEPLACVA